MRRQEPYRSTNAGRATDDLAAKKMGYKPQIEIVHDVDQGARAIDNSASRAVHLPTRILTFYAEATAVTAIMRRAPKSAIAMSNAIRYPMGAAGRIIGASLWSSSAWSAGTAQLQLRISKAGGTETLALLPLPAVIDGATGDDGHIRTQAAEWLCPVKNGLRFAKGESLRLELVLTGWSGAVDWGAELIVAYDGLS